MRIQSIFLLLCLLLLVNVGSAAGERPWIEVRSPHFRVLTNGDKWQARDVAHEFEQMRYLFATEFPQFRLESGAPLTIFAARDEGTAKALDPAVWKRKGAKPAGEFYHGWEKQYVMLRLDQTGLGQRAIVYHEYTHSILHLNSHWLPTWLDEGMAEFYGYTRFEPHQIIIGAITDRYPVLQGTPIPVETLIGVDHASPYYHDPYKVDMFYAESWALVHYAIYGPGMGGGAKLNQFFGMIEKGAAQKQAFQQVFGNFKQVDKALDLYMRNIAFKASAMKDPAKIDEKSFTVTRLTLAQTDAELAGFHLWSHDLQYARPLVAKALKEDPKLGLAHEEDGFLLFADGQDSVARDEFAQAYALDGTLYLALFAKTMLSPIATSDAPADEAAFASALEKVAELNPQFAPAFVQLALLSVRQGKLSQAYAVARRAEELEPSRAGYHLLSGQILLRMGKDAEAAGFAKYVAKHWYGPDHDEAVALWNSVPKADRPTAVTLTDEIPVNTQTAAGVVKSVTCGGAGQPWTMVLDDQGKPMTFRSKGNFAFGFSDTLWWGADHLSGCHHLDGLPAVVHYRPVADTSYAGDPVEIEVRSRFPAAVAN